MPETVRTAARPDGATSKTSASARRRRRSRHRRREEFVLLAFTVPALALYIIFFILPALQSFQYAITNWDGYSADFDYVGLSNFTRALTNDTLFLNSLTNNLKFWLVVVTLQTLFSLMLAVLLFRGTRGSALLRGVFFFPTILSSVSVAYIWRFMYDPGYGPLARLLGLFGADSAFLGNGDIAIYLVALVQVWFHAGQVMTIFIAGLQSVPAELIEAAQVDGAGRWRRFANVTWPLIAPATAIVTAYTTIQSFKAFDLILGLAGNPPRSSMDLMSTRIYTTFANGQFGYAAAEAILFVAMILALTFALRRFLKLTQPGVD